MFVRQPTHDSRLPRTLFGSREGHVTIGRLYIVHRRSDKSYLDWSTDGCLVKPVLHHYTFATQQSKKKEREREEGAQLDPAAHRVL